MSRRIAITLDDPHTEGTPLLDAEARNGRILGVLSRYRVRAALFVCGRRVDSAAGHQLLSAWSARGHILGNHSYSHLSLHSSETEPETFERDIMRADSLLEGFQGYRRIFRYPFLQEGNTVTRRDRVRGFLKARGFSIGHVTVDTSDWYLDMRLRRRLTGTSSVDLGPYRQAFVSHVTRNAEYYDKLAIRAVGRSPVHTLLLHHTLASALFMSALLRTLQRSGWNLVDPEEAFGDPLAQQTPDVCPAGESLVWSIARSVEGIGPQLRYPAEDAMYERPELDRMGL
jgi:peptidoglycan-N-acetylglucosamine deacetylase